jgi:hypothetical protein
VEPWIELREGDLLETLADERGMPETVDLLLLDSVFPCPLHISAMDTDPLKVWATLALPTLEIRRCHHRNLDGSSSGSTPTTQQIWHYKAIARGLGPWTNSTARDYSTVPMARRLVAIL